jgi:hypothetical protein
VHAAYSSSFFRLFVNCDQQIVTHCTIRTDRGEKELKKEGVSCMTFYMMVSRV